jgi:hypothetical protein
MPQSALASPTIEQADNDGAGPDLHTGNLTQASVRMGDWPLIALNQYVWLRLCGTNADGSAYTREIWSAPTAGTNPDWIADRFFTVSLPADELKALQDGSDLELAFKAALGQSTVESEAVEFPVRTYTIKAIEDVRPEITLVEDSKGNEIAKGGFTVDTQITLSGGGAKGQKVQIKDGTTVKGEATVNLTTGLWELTLTGLSLAAHSFTAIALYGGGQVSAAWTLTVTANTPPTITKAIDSKGATIVKGGFTVDTQITLSGAGAKGQKVQIKDGTTVKGEATVNLTTGLWELTLTGLSLAAHSFTAIAKYGSGQVSTAWTLTVTANTAPTITHALDSQGRDIPHGQSTVDTTVKLKGKGAKGQKVQIKDGNIEIDIADINPQGGDWEITARNLSVDSHSFTATAQYGSEQVSNPRVVIISPPLSENFNDRSNVIEPVVLVLPTMTIERNPVAGQHIAILTNSNYEPPFAGKYLGINGDNSTTTFTFRNNYSSISFDYAHTIDPATAKFYDSTNRLLGEITLLTDSLTKPKPARFQGSGIRKMIVTTARSAVVFDNFIFSQ